MAELESSLHWDTHEGGWELFISHVQPETTLRALPWKDRASGATTVLRKARSHRRVAGADSTPDSIASDTPAVGPVGQLNAALAILVAGLQIGWLNRRVAELEARLAEKSASRLSFQPARDAVAELARLSKDWDSYGGLPPTAMALSAAYDLLARVAEQYADETDEDAIPWATAPLADGGVQFEWRSPTGALEVEIDPEGAFHFVRELGETTTEGSDLRGSAGGGQILEQLGNVLGR